MECRKCLGFLGVVVVGGLLVGSFVTKNAHWEKTLQISNKNMMFDAVPQVYRSLEGLLAVDVLLFVLGLATTVFLWLKGKYSAKTLKISLILGISLVFIRFVLGILFLAGENGYCLRQLRYYWDELPENMKDYLEDENFFTSLQSAWVFEIIFNVFFYVLAALLLALLWREAREARENEGKYNEYTI